MNQQHYPQQGFVGGYMPTMAPVYQLPTYDELHKDNLDEARLADKFRLLLNKEPSQDWIKFNKFVKVKDGAGKSKDLAYLPVDKLEYLLNRIFVRWRWVITDYHQSLNAVTVIGRLEYWHPVFNEWDYHTGIGSMGLQLEAGSIASDLHAIKFDAFQKATPAAASYAFKNACKKFGRLFGGDLNNYDVEEYQPIFDIAPDVLTQAQQSAGTNHVDKPQFTQPAPSQNVNNGAPGNHYAQDANGYWNHGPNGPVFTPYQQQQQSTQTNKIQF